MTWWAAAFTPASSHIQCIKRIYIQNTAGWNITTGGKSSEVDQIEMQIQRNRQKLFPLFLPLKQQFSQVRKYLFRVLPFVELSRAELRSLAKNHLDELTPVRKLSHYCWKKTKDEHESCLVLSFPFYLQSSCWKIINKTSNLLTSCFLHNSTD